MRTLIASLFFVLAMDTLGQAIPRFLFRPVVQPFAPMPVRWVNPTTGQRVPTGTPGAVRGPNSYNPDKNGSTDPLTGMPGFNINSSWNPWIDPTTGLPVPAGTPGAVQVNWFSIPGIDPLTGLPVDANQTFGSFANRRITRWSTTTPGGTTLVNPQTNPNLRLYGPVNNGGINFYRAPQRPMIDDLNRSRSYVIPPAITGGPVTVRPQYLGFGVTDYGQNDGTPPAPAGSWPNKVWQDPVGQGGQPNGSRAATQFSTQVGIAGEWSRCYYWYDFNVQSQGRGGLEGLKDFSLAGLPYDILLPGTGTNNTALAGIQALAPQINNPVSVQMGWMIRVTRTSVAVTPATTPPSFRWVVPYTYERVPIGTDGINDTSSSLVGYNRNSLFNFSSFFGNFVVNPGVFSNNQGNNQNSGVFTTNFNPSAIGNVTSTRSMSTMLQYGSLNIKLRMLMRMPALGPEFLFLNMQNPTFNGRPNILQ